MQQMIMNRSEIEQKCIDDCMNCYRVCEESIAMCLSIGGEHAEDRHITTMDDCAKLCAISADFMLRNSDLDTHMCSLCAQACDNCAESCAKFDDDFMKKCADICKQCAESCRSMERMTE